MGAKGARNKFSIRFEAVQKKSMDTNKKIHRFDAGST
jgi:hypothetical protein